MSKIRSPRRLEENLFGATDEQGETAGKGPRGGEGQKASRNMTTVSASPRPTRGLPARRRAQPSRSSPAASNPPASCPRSVAPLSGRPLQHPYRPSPKHLISSPPSEWRLAPGQRKKPITPRSPRGRRRNSDFCVLWRGRESAVPAGLWSSVSRAGGVADKAAGVEKKRRATKCDYQGNNKRLSTPSHSSELGS